MGERPLVMGILNLTPDSFSDGGCFAEVDAAVAHALALEEQGADLIDVGGESTRPGAAFISTEEEWLRVQPVLERLARRLKIPVSIDTWKASVAQRSIDCGAVIVNDVSGGGWDAELWPVVARSGAGYVLMHAQGQPATMQVNPQYEDVVGEVRDYLERRLVAAEEAGIRRERVVCDVGFGFGKKLEHNLALLSRLGEFASLGRPMLVGLSRKSFVKKLGGEAALPLCTELAHVWAAAQGATIWRVHDVAAAVTASRLIGQLRGVNKE